MSQNWAESPFLSPTGGGGNLSPSWRDALDFERSMWRKTPGAVYPDGYLGTIHSRREDRLLDSLKNRENQRSYQRGVHKGERIDRADYFWPAAFGPQSGIAAEAQGMRQAPVSLLAARNQPQESQMLPRGTGGLVTLNRTPREINPVRVQQLRRLAPSWR